MSDKVYQRITDTILERLDAGVIPWRKTWSGGSEGMPINLRGTLYRGVNVFMLAFQPYGSRTWLTFKQAKAAGGSVRKGEKATPVIFWKWLDAKDADTGQNARIPLLRHYNVFNVEQCDGVEDPHPRAATPNVVDAIESAQAIADAYRGAPTLRHGGDRACYNPGADVVSMPERDAFEGGAEYYSTLFHEFAHSTGHASRLDRDGITNPISFASHEYAKEELVAEFAATYCCGVAGIERGTIDNSAAYIDHWSRQLRKDSRLIIGAAGQAQKAADWIRGERKHLEAKRTA